MSGILQALGNVSPMITTLFYCFQQNSRKNRYLKKKRTVTAEVRVGERSSWSSLSPQRIRYGRTLKKAPLSGSAIPSKEAKSTPCYPDRV